MLEITTNCFIHLYQCYFLKVDKLLKAMEKFDILVKSIFKAKKVESFSILIVVGHIPKRFKIFLNDIILLKPGCKIFNCLKKENYYSIIGNRNITDNRNLTILIASFNKNTPEILLKQTSTTLFINLNVLNLTPRSSGIFFGCLNKWSRPLIVFETIFGERPELKIFKILMSSFFKSNKNDKNISPSSDHLIAFFYVNSKILLRIYQISKKKKERKNKSKKQFYLIEIGPRVRFKVNHFSI